MTWFFLARVSVYGVTNKADLEVDRAAHPVESAVSGRVVATHLALDQEVKAGDVLVELDSGAQPFQLSEEKTQLAGANPQIHSREEGIASAAILPSALLGPFGLRTEPNSVSSIFSAVVLESLLVSNLDQIRKLAGCHRVFREAKRHEAALRINRGIRG